MSEAEVISGLAHGSGSPSTQVNSNHHTTDEADGEGNNKPEGNSDSLKRIVKDSTDKIQQKKFDSTIESGIKPYELLLENSSINSPVLDPISSLEEITNGHRGSSISNRRIGDRCHESDEELLDIQAIEEDVNRTQSISANEIRLIHGASLNNNDQVTTPKSDANNIKLNNPSTTTAKIAGRSRKVSTIPVGIAVAWQRNCTNTTTTNCATNSTSTLTSTMSSNNVEKAKKLVKSPKTSPLLHNTLPPADIISETSSNKKDPKKKEKGLKATSTNINMSDAKLGRTINLNNKSVTSDSALNLKSSVCEKRHEKEKYYEKVKSNNISNSTSSSFTPVTPVSSKASCGNSNSSINERFNNNDGDGGFKSLNNNNNTLSLYRDSWPSSQPLVPQGYAACAAFLQQQQQLSMHQTMQLQLSQYGYNISSCIYSGGGYTPEALMQYEQFLRQQQLLLERQDQQQQQQNQRERFELAQRQGIKNLVVPNRNASPRINIPTPSPAHSNVQQQSLYAHHNSSWPVDLYQQYQQLISSPPAHQQYHHQQYNQQQAHQQHLLHQQMITTAGSSTATLSPRSLSSTTPSPITIHDSGFQSLLNRKCITPNPMSKHFPTFSSPFSPSLIPIKDTWRDDCSIDDNNKLTPIPLVMNSHHHRSKKSSTISSIDDTEERKDQQEELLLPLDLDERRLSNISRCDSRQLSSPSYFNNNNNNNNKHDFRRMESLIEKRAEETLPMLSSSGSIISVNETGELEEVEEEEEGGGIEDEVLDLKVVKSDVNNTASNQNLLVVKNVDDDEIDKISNCDGKEMVVPDSKSTLKNKKGINIKKAGKSVTKTKTVSDKKATAATTLKLKEKKHQQQSAKKKIPPKSKSKLKSNVIEKRVKEADFADTDSIKKDVKKRRPAVKEQNKKLSNNKRMTSNVEASKSLKPKNTKKSDKKASRPMKKKPNSSSKKTTTKESKLINGNGNLNLLNIAEDGSIIYKDNLSHSASVEPIAAASSLLQRNSLGLNLNSSAGTQNLTLHCDNDIKNPNNFHLGNSTSTISHNPSQSQQIFTSAQTEDRRLSSHSQSSSHSHENNSSIDSNNTLVFHSLPTITISPEENHLNLLATVAEEVGPYITNRNVSPIRSIRFDLTTGFPCDNNNSYLESQDDWSFRRHSTESLYAAVAVAAAAEESRTKSKSLDLSSIEPHLANANITKNEIDDSSSYQLKIPQVIPKFHPNKGEESKPTQQLVSKIKKPSSNEQKQKNNNNNTQKKLMKKDLLNQPTLLKSFKKNSSDSQKERIQKTKKKYILSRKGISDEKSSASKNTKNKSNGNNKKKKYSIIPKVEFTTEILEPVSNSTELSSCVYDFDDTKPIQLEPLFNRSEKKKKESIFNHNNAKIKTGGKQQSQKGSEGNSSTTKSKSKKYALNRRANYDLKTLKLLDRTKNKRLNKRNPSLKETEKTTIHRNKNINMRVNNINAKGNGKEHVKDEETTTFTKKKVPKKIPSSNNNNKNAAATAAANNPTSTSNTALVERFSSSSTEISPAVESITQCNIKTEAPNSPFSSSSTASLPLHLLTSSPSSSSTHIPHRIHNPSSIDTCSNISSNSESWMTITNPVHVVSAVKTEHKESNEREDENEIVKSISSPNTKRKMQLKPASKIEAIRSSTDEIFKRISSIDKHQQAKLSPKRKNSKDSASAAELYIKPCLKVEPIIRSVAEENAKEKNSTTNSSHNMKIFETKSGEKIKFRKQSIDMNIFSRKVKNEHESTTDAKKLAGEDREKEIWDDNVVINGVEDMIDEMRILTEIEGLFYTGKLNALQPPDVYGVTLDNERGAPPHIIFSAEEVLSKCIREAKPWKPSQLPHGLRICAYWSPMYTGLYPGKVSTDYDKVGDLVPVEFDDGDTGVIKINEIRMLAPNHPVAEYDPNPLLTLEKKHRKRRSSSANGSQGGCTGDHEETDCGEPYCAKVAKLDEEEEEEEEKNNDDIEEDDKDFNNTYRTKMQYWAWSGLGYKRPKTKKNRHKEFFHGIQRGEEIINVGDSALFISNGNDRPFIGRIERFWEKKGQKIVNVRWFYHPEEVKTKKRFVIKYPGALFESPHIDENDVQTIAKKCEVIPFQEYKQKYGHRLKLLDWKTGGGGGGSGKGHRSNDNSSRRIAPKHTYYVAGFYDPYTYNLQMKDLK